MYTTRRKPEFSSYRSSMRGPLLLLSPAKTLNFDSALSVPLRTASVTQPRFAVQSSEICSELAKLSCPQIKSLMGLSDSLAALNHGRFANFDQQAGRLALGAFEGAAYKGLDAHTLNKDELAYLQDSLRILCGLYGVLAPFDEIRPYRLEMSTRLKVGQHANLYRFWATEGSDITKSLRDELASRPDGASKFVLNVASQEYAKAVDLAALGVPVITAVFPGPAVHAKQARGAMVRFCARERVVEPRALAAFSGENGEWSFVPGESTESSYVFHRTAGDSKKAPSTVVGSAVKRKAADAEEGAAAQKTAKASSRRSTRR